MDKTDLAILSRKYLDGTATAAERARLLAWYNAYDEHELAVYLQADAGETEATLEARLQHRILAATAPAPMRAVKGRRVAWVAAAAAIILLISVGRAWYLRQPAIMVTAAEPALYVPITAGTNKATLTLADGSVVALDSLHGGQQLQQGQSQITQAVNGKIVYAATLASNKAAAYNTLKTPRGGQYNVALADGTEVWLNAASSITYPAAFTGKERRVTVTGEAYFEVAASASQPFIVEANGTEVLVLGTHFNINAYDDEQSINTTLTEGAVLVKSATIARLLSPGQQARVAKGSGDIALEPKADMNNILAWKNGYFSFDNADIPAVMRQLARWYNIDVTYEGKLPEFTFTGEIGRSLTEEQLLNVLTKAGIHFKADGHRLTITQ